MNATSHDDKVYLQHILDSIKNVEKFTDGNLDEFHEDTKSWFTTTRSLQIMAESATKISEGIKAKMPNIRLAKHKGFS